MLVAQARYRSRGGYADRRGRDERESEVKLFQNNSSDVI
jgi:hypothetical protein